MDDENDGEELFDPRCHAAFITLYAQEYYRLVGFLRHIMRDPFWAEDAAQEAFLAVVRQWATIQSPRPFLYKVAIRQSGRAKYRRLPSLPDDYEFKDLASDQADSTDDRIDQIRAAMAGLPDRQREAMLLYYLADLPVTEVADIMRVTVGAVKAHLSKAREKLRAILAPHPPRTTHEQ
jgi:RNA polymerase sigma factor (sigma-70 family)